MAGFEGSPSHLPDKSAGAAEAGSTAELSHLSKYGLAGLRRCWMPERGTWSHKYHLDGRPQPNESVPPSDLYYSLNVLLGLSRVPGALAAEPYEVPDLLVALCRGAMLLPVRNGTWGMASWAAAELDLDLPAPLAAKMAGFAKDPSELARWRTQDIGLTLSGACALAARDPSWRPLAGALRDLLMSEFRGRGALFRDSGRGPRRYIATFATQVYAALALYQYGELAEDAAAIQAANACVEKLIAVQGELGEWPWFYSPDTEAVVDRYEVYSVHQHGMAPALLHHAVRHGVPGSRAAVVRGFEWIFGANEMGISMLLPGLQLIYRSQALRGLHARREMRVLRAVASAVTRSGGRAAGAAALRLTEEMRSYEFGWLLWSFGGRTDYPELTNHAQFVAAA